MLVEGRVLSAQRQVEVWLVGSGLFLLFLKELIYFDCFDLILALKRHAVIGSAANGRSYVVAGVLLFTLDP